MDWVEKKSKKNGESSFYIEDSTIYECKKCHKMWIFRVENDKECRDLLLIMDDSISITVEEKKKTEVYVMNDEGKTIECIRWT